MDLLSVGIPAFTLFSCGYVLNILRIMAEGSEN